MKSITGRRGYTLLELIVGMSIMLIAIAIIVPKGTTTKDNATTKTAAEELVARFRQARQTAITKAVPVGVAFPITSGIYHTDRAYFLEGEVNPRVTEQWMIQQTKPNVAYFSGTWAGPSWAPGNVLTSPSQGFDPSLWFGPTTPPDATIFIFTPSGTMVSEAQAADGKYRVVVGMGVSSGGSSTLVAVNSPYTVWISPSGEVGLDKGVSGGAVIETTNKDSSPLAEFVVPEAGANSSPVVQAIAPATATGARAYPDNVNPKTNNGNMIDLDSVLTLEVRVKDLDGDPPYFQWFTTEVGIADEVNEGEFTPEDDLDTWGGRFSNAGEVRMEWDAQTQEWVGRDTWAPATGDKGGNQYKLECSIRDRRGGEVQTSFPVDGNYLVTSKEPWVLYKSWNAAGRSELWKMTLDGLEHTRVVSFGYQEVDFGQWSPSGADIIVGAADGVYRVSANGGNLAKMSSVNLGGPVDGCCLSPAGDALYYIGGPNWNKRIRKVYFDPNTGNPNDVALGAGGSVGVKDTHDLSAAAYGDKVVLMSSFYWNNTSSLFGTGFFKKKKKRSGGLVIDAGLGTGNIPSDDDGEDPDEEDPDADPDAEYPVEDLPSEGEGDSSGTKSAWRGRGADNNNVTYGISLNYTTDETAQEQVHVLYGRGNGNIYAIKTLFAPGADVADGFLPGPDADVIVNGMPFGTYPLTTGMTDVHHPKYGSKDRDSLVFVAGRGTASRIYYWPKLNDPSTIRQLPLAPSNRGATQPSISRPRVNTAD